MDHFKDFMRSDETLHVGHYTPSIPRKKGQDTPLCAQPISAINGRASWPMSSPSLKRLRGACLPSFTRGCPYLMEVFYTVDD